MIPRGQQWDEIAAATGGDLSVTSYAVLLAAMARSGRNGVLRLVRRPVAKQIYLTDGRPVECRSNLAHETLGRFLRSENVLSEEDYRATLADSLSREVPLGEVLIEREILTPQDVLKHLQRNHARKLLDGFTWDRGEFEFEDGRPAPDATVKVNAPQLILTGVLKLTPQAEIDAGLERFQGEPIVVDQCPPFRDASLRFAGRAERVLQALQVEALGVAEVASITSLDADEVARVVYALALLGQVATAQELAHRKPSAERRPAETEPELATERPVEPSDDQALLLRQTKIVEAYLSFRRKDSFDFLELEEGCSVEDIDRAYLDAAATYAPWSLEEMGVTDFVEQGELLFLKAARAYAELSNSETRGSLIHRRKVLRDEEADRKKAKFSIKTDLLDSEEQFKKGLALADGGELGKALELLEFAVSCDPQSAVYRAELAHRRDEFEAHRWRKQSIADLKEAIRIDPSCGVAHYYLGLILGAGGDHADPAAAEELLRKSIKLMAPDRRPIEALKELSAKKR
ncbi:MAG: DUF4388 domain-containing protein [Thermoanaerobaculia bacterium]